MLVVRKMLFKKNNTEFWLVAGLGNPGLQYEKTRHNVGFMAADKIAEKYSVQLSKHKFDAVYGDFKIGENRILLAKPKTYMNNSGKAILALSTFYKVPKERIIIMHDDVSLDVGKLRIRRKGSHGGQNGMRDIIEVIGTDEIARIKIGVGQKPNPQYDLADWVLGKIPADDIPVLDKTLDNSVKAVAEIINRSIDSAMNKYSK